MHTRLYESVQYEMEEKSILMQKSGWASNSDCSLGTKSWQWATAHRAHCPIDSTTKWLEIVQYSRDATYDQKCGTSNIWNKRFWGTQS